MYNFKNSFKINEVMDDEVLIIGAGPAGMAAAMELSKANKKFLVVEKQDKIGGLAKTHTFKEG